MAKALQCAIGIAHIRDVKTTLSQVLAHDRAQIKFIIHQQQALAPCHALRKGYWQRLIGNRLMAPREKHGNLGTLFRRRLDPGIAA
ncbi:hypothetical protein D3C78_1718710 [compost metagenome]